MLACLARALPADAFVDYCLIMISLLDIRILAAPTLWPSAAGALVSYAMPAGFAAGSSLCRAGDLPSPRRRFAVAEFAPTPAHRLSRGQAMVRFRSAPGTDRRLAAALGYSRRWPGRQPRQGLTTAHTPRRAPLPFASPVWRAGICRDDLLISAGQPDADD